jgi:hypothetical protein
MTKLRCGLGSWVRWRSLREFSFAPLGLGLLLHLFPTACAVGCILAPLRGWGSEALRGIQMVNGWEDGPDLSAEIEKLDRERAGRWEIGRLGRE